MSLTTPPYGRGMNLVGQDSLSGSQSAGDLLRAGLARAERARAAIPPVLGHLVSNEQQVLFSDEAVARTRGMIESLARQLACRTADAGGEDSALSAGLAAHEGLLAHCHALALEAQLTERLARDAGLDPVLTPLLQDLIAAPEAESAALAMTLLAAQARFVQGQRRMETAIDQLPADLLHDVLVTFVQTCGARAEQVAADLRSQFDEGRSRTALLARVLLDGDGTLAAALSPDRAGLALFVSALALSTGVDRDTAVIAAMDGQQARLALLLAACGLDAARIEAIVLSFHPDAPLAPLAAALGREEARHLLAEKA